MIKTFHSTLWSWSNWVFTVNRRSGLSSWHITDRINGINCKCPTVCKTIWLQSLFLVFSVLLSTGSKNKSVQLFARRFECNHCSWCSHCFYIILLLIAFTDSCKTMWMQRCSWCSNDGELLAMMSWWFQARSYDVFDLKHHCKQFITFGIVLLLHDAIVLLGPTSPPSSHRPIMMESSFWS